MRPSASVLAISTVCPSYMRTTSPGRIAVPDGMFSANGAQATTSMGRSSCAIAWIAATTAAAPAMSNFIVAMVLPGLIVSPPES